MFTIPTGLSRIVCTLAVLAFATSALAQHRVSKLARPSALPPSGSDHSIASKRLVPVLRPIQQAEQDTPRLGFYGHIVPDFGLVVDAVVIGEKAEKLGLESGDVIVVIDDQPIDSIDAYFSSLAAAGDGGHLIVRDVRTGRHVKVPLAADEPVGPGNVPTEPKDPEAPSDDTGDSPSDEAPGIDDAADPQEMAPEVTRAAVARTSSDRFVKQQIGSGKKLGTGEGTRGKRNILRQPF